MAGNTPGSTAVIAWLLSTGSSENNIDQKIGGTRRLPRNGGRLLQDLYIVYSTLKEQILDDKLFDNMRRVNSECGEPKSLGFQLTLLCSAASGTLATLATLPTDMIQRRMQIQNFASAHGGETDSAEIHF